MWGRSSKKGGAAPPPLRFRSIVAGVDEGPASLLAVRWAAELARLHGAAVHIVSAGQARSAPGPIAAQPGDLDAEMLQEQALDPEAAAARAMVECHAQGILATSEVASGSPAPALLRAVRDQAADLVILGSHGHGRSAFKAASGVAQDVKNDATAHVLIARGEPPPGRVVACSDGSLQAGRAVRAAADLAAAWRAPLTLVRVGMGSAAAAPPEGLPAGAEVRDLVGNASDEIVVEAKRLGAGLVVLGGRGSGGLSALSLGSVSDRVSVFADTSVLVVKALA